MRICRGLKSTNIRCSQSQFMSTVSSNKTKLCIISGPTGIGKTQLSLNLAQSLNTSIISADSVQCYKHLDIGSAKISAQIRDQIKHHCIDIYDIIQTHNTIFTIADWLQHCTAAIHDITQTNNTTVPLIVGGSGFYLRWLLYGPTQTPKTTPESKQYANTLLQQLQSNALTLSQIIQLLHCTDESVQWLTNTVNCSNTVRIERCIEILYLTNGHKPTDYTEQTTLPRTELQYDVRCFYLYPVHRAWLQRLVNYRCELMIQYGLIQEVLQLEQYNINDTLCSLAIGYRQTIEFIHHIRQCTDQKQRIQAFYNYVDALQTATRQYVRRQGTWFRNEALYDFIPVDHNVSTNYDTLPPHEKITQLILPTTAINQIHQYIQQQVSMSYTEYVQHTQSYNESDRQIALRDQSKSSNDKSVRYLQSENLIYYNDTLVLKLLNSIDFDR